MSTVNLKLTTEELDIQLETILSFLKKVHPTLENETGYRPCVEIRPIIRNGKTVPGRSFNIWDLSTSNITRLKNFLEKLNGTPVCLFYSVYHFDNNKEIVNKAGKLQRHTRILSDNAIGTYEITLDFDNIGFSEYISLVDRFEELGIFALWVSSGHGYQAHILLNEEIRDKQAIKHVVELMLDKGFNCDPTCSDPARIMRLPSTFNCKCFVDSQYETEKTSPPRCEIVQDSIARYSFAEIIEAFQSLPAVNKKESDVSEKIVIKIEDTFINYPHIKLDLLPEPVSKMLLETPHGYRNNVLGFLIRFLKTQYRLNKSQIEDVLIIWGNEACKPAYDLIELKKDFERIYYKYDGLSYNSSLAAKFGTIEFSELITLRKKDILIPHSFSKDLSILDGKAVRVFLALKLLEHNQDEATQNTLSEKLDITVRALRPSVQSLVDAGHAYTEKGNRRLGIPDKYHSNKIFSTNEGYSIYSYNDIETYLRDFSEKNSKYNELKIYLFFRYKFYTGEIYMSQTNIGKHIGVAQNTVSDIVNRLVERKYLKISRRYHSPALFSLEYTLLR